MKVAGTLLLIGLSFGGLQSAAAQSKAPPAKPICTTPQHRAFDFWIGEWSTYVTGTDTLAGLSSISLSDDGCVISEIWHSKRANYSGRSLNIYSAESGHWEQFWVDSTGDIIHFIGNPTPSGMQLTAEDDIGPGAPQPVFNRMTFTKNPDGTIRQHGEASTDRGKTWTTRYDFTYRKTGKS